MGSTSDSSTRGNLFVRDTVHLLVAAVLSLGRMWMDVFILAVNCRDWMKKKYLSLTDRILTLQGSIRICIGCMGILWYILVKFCPWTTQTDYMDKVVTFSLWFFTACNLWLTASLCSYYCVKIADFSHPFFIRLKLRLSRLESTWLLGSGILSLATSLPNVWSDLEMQSNKNFSNLFHNKNVTGISQTKKALHVLALQGLGYFVAFIICATSALLLLFSLWRHHHRMLGSWEGQRSPQTTAHFQAVVIVLSLLITNVVFFISVLLALSSDFDGNRTAHTAATAVLHSCFSVECLISILGNKKLKNELCRAFYVAKCRGRAS